MADRDFANESVGDTPPRAKRRVGVIIVLLFMLFALAGSFGGGFWMGMQYVNKEIANTNAGKPGDDTVKLKAKLEMLEVELRHYEQEAKEREAALKSATAAVGDLTFYKDLPEQAVAPKPLAPPSQPNAKPNKKPNAKKPSTSKPKTDVSAIIRQEMAAKPGSKARADGNYLMQVGSFQRRPDAEELKQQLAGLKLRSSIEPSMVPGLGLWYRVHLGPYASRKDAEADKARVQSGLHITGLIIKR